jgi:hypothetical protein
METTLSLAEAASRADVSKPTVRARLKKAGHDPETFRMPDGSLRIPVSALLKAGLTLTGPREKGDESRETDVPAPGTSGDVLTVRLEAAEALAAERLDRVRFLERELDRRSDELGALRLELTMLREVFSGPQALGTSRSSGWFRRSRTE